MDFLNAPLYLLGPLAMRSLMLLSCCNGFSASFKSCSTKLARGNCTKNAPATTGLPRTNEMLGKTSLECLGSHSVPLGQVPPGAMVYGTIQKLWSRQMTRLQKQTIHHLQQVPIPSDSPSRRKLSPLVRRVRPSYFILACVKGSFRQIQNFH